MQEDFALFDFRLTDHEMTAISRLDRGERAGPNPDDHHKVQQAA